MKKRKIIWSLKKKSWSENGNGQIVSQVERSAETNLVDAYKRIEKLKLAIDTYKSNEDDLKASVNEFQIKLKRSEDRYQKLKNHAAEKVEA